MQVLDTATGGAMDDEDLSVVKYAAIHPSDKKKVVYVIYYSQIGILYCHALGFRNKATAQAVSHGITATTQHPPPTKPRLNLITSGWVCGYS